MYLLITNDNSVYYAHSNIEAFIIGGLANLGVQGKEMTILKEIAEDMYLKGEGIDIGSIVDYVYVRRNDIDNYNRKEWTLDLVGEQW
jgi:hypothetical protein